MPAAMCTVLLPLYELIHLVRKHWHTTGLWWRPIPHLLGLPLLPHGDHVHCWLWRCCLQNSPWKGLHCVLSFWRAGEFVHSLMMFSLVIVILFIANFNTLTYPCLHRTQTINSMFYWPVLFVHGVLFSLHANFTVSIVHFHAFGTAKRFPWRAIIMLLSLQRESHFVCYIPLLPVGKQWWPARLYQCPRVGLLGVCVLPHGHHVHSWLWRHCLQNHFWKNFPNSLFGRGPGESVRWKDCS